MKVSQIPSIAQGAESQAAKMDSIRSLKMKVNVTPGLTDQPMGEAQPELPQEAPKEETTAAVEATEPLSPQFAALAKQKRALQQERRAFEDERKAFEATKSQGGDYVTKAQLKSEPLKYLLDAGVTYDDLANAVLVAQQNPELLTLRTKLESLEKGVDQKFQEKAEQDKQSALTQMRREASQLITAGDEFELIRETKSLNYVMTLIEKTYDDTGEVLDVPEALKLVEDELLERQKKLVRLKKMQSLVQPQATAPQATQRPAMRTLTNQHTASVPMSAKQRALAAFRGELKK